MIYSRAKWGREAKVIVSADMICVVALRLVGRRRTNLGGYRQQESSKIL
jgi:hypothetical protein